MALDRLRPMKTPLRVLMVEDDGGDADYIRELLSGEERAHFSLEQAGSLSEGVRRLQEERFDILLLDLGLPESQGLDTFMKCRDFASEVPIVVLTGLSDEEVAMQAVQKGAQDYLVKGDIDGRLLTNSIYYAVERHRLLQAQRSLSFQDELTGLYNRRGFTFLAHKQLKAARRIGNAACLLFMDLDGLKWINDSLGHSEGDRALVDTAAVLKATFRRGSDMSARLGGDEFAVLAFTDRGKGCGVLEEMLDRGVEAFNALQKRPYRLSLSVGTICCDPDAPGCAYDIDKLLALADRFMYERKFQKREDRRAVP